MLDHVRSLLKSKVAPVASPATDEATPSSDEPVSHASSKLHPAISIDDEGQAVRRLCVRKYGAGKSDAWMSGPGEYAETAAECLLRSFTTMSYIMEDLFRERMRQKGVPEDVIDEFLRGSHVIDEAFLSERD